MRFDAVCTRGVVLGLSVNLMFVPAVRAQAAVPAPVVPVSAPVTTPGQTIRPGAEAAYQEGQGLLQSAKYTDAVAKLDLAIAMEPSWSAPVKLRAEAFARLAEIHAPSEAFLMAEATDLERLMVLEPGVDTASRQQRAIQLRVEATEARQKESRRRKMTKPALIYIALNISMLVSGALMTSFYPSTPIDAIGQRRYVYTGVTMLGIGAAMIPGSIALGVLAGRQVKRDAAVADFNVETGRQRPAIGVAPQFMPGGGGLGLNLRF